MFTLEEFQQVTTGGLNARLAEVDRTARALELLRISGSRDSLLAAGLDSSWVDNLIATLTGLGCWSASESTLTSKGHKEIALFGLSLGLLAPDAFRDYPPRTDGFYVALDLYSASDGAQEDSLGPLEDALVHLEVAYEEEGFIPSTLATEFFADLIQGDSSPALRRAWILTLSGDILADLGRLEAALEAYEKALTLAVACPNARAEVRRVTSLTLMLLEREGARRPDESARGALVRIMGSQEAGPLATAVDHGKGLKRFVVSTSAQFLDTAIPFLLGHQPVWDGLIREGILPVVEDWSWDQKPILELLGTGGGTHHTSRLNAAVCNLYVLLQALDARPAALVREIVAFRVFEPVSSPLGGNFYLIGRQRNGAVRTASSSFRVIEELSAEAPSEPGKREPPQADEIVFRQHLNELLTAGDFVTSPGDLRASLNHALRSLGVDPSQVTVREFAPDVAYEVFRAGSGSYFFGGQDQRAALQRDRSEEFLEILNGNVLSYLGHQLPRQLAQNVLAVRAEAWRNDRNRVEAIVRAVFRARLAAGGDEGRRRILAITSSRRHAATGVDMEMIALSSTINPQTLAQEVDVDPEELLVELREELKSYRLREAP